MFVEQRLLIPHFTSFAVLNGLNPLPDGRLCVSPSCDQRGTPTSPRQRYLGLSWTWHRAVPRPYLTMP
ncbi:MAG: hypothetical protein ACFFDI_28485, partial [Promethearchaeota archaeon]